MSTSAITGGLLSEIASSPSTANLFVTGPNQSAETLQAATRARPSRTMPRCCRKTP
jgi:hypothetical protein